MMPNDLTDVERVILQNTGRLDRVLFVVAGPSGVGKNTIIKRLLANHPCMGRMRTFTTRRPRPGEVEGEQYHFVTHEEYRALAVAGRLKEANAETEGHKVYGPDDELYSMPADIFEEILPEQHLVIAEVDVDGTKLLRGEFPDCVTVFVTAPSAELKERIQEREDPNMSDAALAQRMSTAHEQIREADKFDYVVFNHKNALEAAVEAVETIIYAERMRVRPGFDLEAVMPADTFSMIPPDDDPLRSTSQ